MSKHSTEAAAAAVVSPKVQAAAAWSAVLIVVGGAAASAIAAIPDSAWEGLGVWAGPVGVFVGGLGVGLAAVVAAYRKGDPLRNLGGVVADLGGTAPPPPVTSPPADLPEVVELEEQPDPDSPVADQLAADVAHLRGEA